MFSTENYAGFLCNLAVQKKQKTVIFINTALVFMSIPVIRGGFLTLPAKNVLFNNARSASSLSFLFSAIYSVSSCASSNVILLGISSACVRKNKSQSYIIHGPVAQPGEQCSGTRALAFYQLSFVNSRN